MLPVVSATEVFEALPRNTNPDPLPLTNTFENGDTAEIKKWLTPRVSRMAKAVVGDACWIVDVMKAGAFTPPNADKSSASAGLSPDASSVVALPKCPRQSLFPPAIASL